MYIGHVERRSCMSKLLNAIYYRLFRLYKKIYLQVFSKKTVDILGEKANLENELIVSFTTIPSRLNYLPSMIKSIFNQTIIPNRFIMYVYKDEFEGINLESILELEIKNGLEIVYVDENLRSHKKYFYAMKDNPNSIVVLVDDDIIYPRNTIKKLIASYRIYPQCVSAMRCHRIKLFSDGSLYPYNQWEYEISGATIPSYFNFFTSGGGTLFPPCTRNEDLFNKKNIKDLSFLADDVWLNFLAVKNGIKTVKATRYKGTPLTIDDNPEESLVYLNAVYGNNNDKCIKNMVDFYHIDFSEVD